MKMNNELDNTEETIFKQMIWVKYHIDALKFGTNGTNIDESKHKEIINYYESIHKAIIISYDMLTDMVFKYIEKLKQNENE